MSAAGYCRAGKALVEKENCHIQLIETIYLCVICKGPGELAHYSFEVCLILCFSSRCADGTGDEKRTILRVCGSLRFFFFFLLHTCIHSYVYIYFLKIQCFDKKLERLYNIHTPLMRVRKYISEVAVGWVVFTMAFE